MGLDSKISEIFSLSDPPLSGVDVMSVMVTFDCLKKS
jgi:hypothetical protein